jgi:hypothetical protein
VAARVVAGQVVALYADAVTIAVGVDPDTGETLTVSAAVPALAVGAVAWAVIGEHGAVILPGPGGAAAPIDVQFRTYAELRDGITVPRPAALSDDPDPEV